MCGEFLDFVYNSVKPTARGRKTAREPIEYKVRLCPACKEKIFPDGIIRALTCPLCKEHLMLVDNKLERWIP